MTVTISELAARAGEIVREVANEGREVEVERDGKVIVRIVPAVPEAFHGDPADRIIAATARAF